MVAELISDDSTLAEKERQRPLKRLVAKRKAPLLSIDEAACFLRTSKGTLKELDFIGRGIGFFLGAVLLNTLVCVEPGGAQCGPGTPGSGNTACGTGALANNTWGTDDSAFGFDALYSNTGNVYDTEGNSNTAIGDTALRDNTSGLANTACGGGALISNTAGSYNAASGFAALTFNTTGSYNTASGFDALVGNTTGNDNTATGYYAMGFGTTMGSGITTGAYNTATGAYALADDTTGSNNIATGAGAAQNNTTGSGNLAEGGQTLYSNRVGSSNTALGGGALKNSTSSNNIAVGFKAGWNITTRSNNIDIGSMGAASDANTVRIGAQGMQTATFIAGVSGILSGGSEATELAVNRTTGQVGVIPSSARFKRDIHDMGGASAGLMRLRPVSFRYKDDPSGTLQYGLIAEEVARVYPEMVIRGTDGKVESVRYLELTGLLLNELQKQATKVAAQQREIDELKQKDASINALSERLAVLEQQARTAIPQGLRLLASK